jgi:hypothetical protein
MAGQEYTIDQQTWEDLASRLQQFSGALPPEQQTVLRALLIMAGKEIDGAPDVQGYELGGGLFTNSVQLGSPTNFSAGFQSAFGTFTGGSLKPQGPSLAKYTTCVI